MSNKPPSLAAHTLVGQLFTSDTRVNGQPFTILEQRHVLLRDNAVYLRLRLKPENGPEVQLDMPIDTNMPAQLDLLDSQESEDTRHVQTTITTPNP